VAHELKHVLQPRIGRPSTADTDFESVHMEMRRKRQARSNKHEIS